MYYINKVALMMISVRHFYNRQFARLNDVSPACVSSTWQAAYGLQPAVYYIDVGAMNAISISGDGVRLGRLKQKRSIFWALLFQYLWWFRFCQSAHYWALCRPISRAYALYLIIAMPQAVAYHALDGYYLPYCRGDIMTYWKVEI